MGGAGALVVGWTMSMAVCLLAGVAQTRCAVDSDGSVGFGRAVLLEGGELC